MGPFFFNFSSTTSAMTKPLCIALALIFFSASAHGQQRWISGYLKDSITHFPISGGTISNPATRNKVQTDINGFFRIRVQPNEVLYALAQSYKYDTLRYTILFGDTLTIYLEPAGNILANVTVQARYTRYQIDSMERRATFDQMRGQKLGTVSSDRSLGFGIALNLDRFTKKKYRNQKREEAFFEKTEQIAYINYRFSPQLVASYTGLKGEELRRFMYLYTPDYQWLRQHPSNDDIIYYLNDKLKQFRSAGNKQQQNNRMNQ